MESKAHINLDWRDKSNSLCLHAVVARAYNHLYQKGFPLPYASTLTLYVPHGIGDKKEQKNASALKRWCGKVSHDECKLWLSLELMKSNTEYLKQSMHTSF